MKKTLRPLEHKMWLCIQRHTQLKRELELIHKKMYGCYKLGKKPSKKLLAPYEAIICQMKSLTDLYNWYEQELTNEEDIVSSE